MIFREEDWNRLKKIGLLFRRQGRDSWTQLMTF